MPAVAMAAAMSAWRRMLRATEVRLEAVRPPAAAVISVPVVEEFTESHGERASHGVAAGEPAPLAGRYELGEHVATSRLGRTYRAWDAGSDQDVEVTFLSVDAIGGESEAEARLEQLRSLQHLHVLPLLDWQLDPVPYLVHPAPAMRLADLIAGGVALSPSQALLIGLQAAETLANLREAGITHGALTPSDFCLDVRGRLRLAGMGVDFLRTPRHAPETSRYDEPRAELRAELRAEPRAEPRASRPVEQPGLPPTAPDVLALLEGFDTAGSPGDDPTDEARYATPPGAGGSGEVAPAADASAGSPPDEGSVAAAADVYGLGLALAEAVVGGPLERAAIGGIGRSIVPPGAGANTVRNLSHLAPLLAQATMAGAARRLGADEFALALRATAEMFPPPERLDEAFGSVAAYAVEAPAASAAATGAEQAPRPSQNALVRLVAAAAVVVAAALLVVSTIGGDRTPSHTVPEVVGQSWEQAGETLAELGWDVRRLEVRVRGVPPGEVVGQLPEPGGLLDEGQVVKVQVSLGEPLVIIPADIVGLSLHEAGLRLSAIGLGVGAVTERVDPSVPAGAVVAISEVLPEVPRGSQIGLVVAVAG